MVKTGLCASLNEHSFFYDNRGQCYGRWTGWHRSSPRFPCIFCPASEVAGFQPRCWPAMGLLRAVGWVPGVGGGCRGKNPGPARLLGGCGRQLRGVGLWRCRRLGAGAFFAWDRGSGRFVAAKGPECRRFQSAFGRGRSAAGTIFGSWKVECGCSFFPFCLRCRLYPTSSIVWWRRYIFPQHKSLHVIYYVERVPCSSRIIPLSPPGDSQPINT